MQQEARARVERLLANERSALRQCIAHGFGQFDVGAPCSGQGCTGLGVWLPQLSVPIPGRFDSQLLFRAARYCGRCRDGWDGQLSTLLDPKVIGILKASLGPLPFEAARLAWVYVPGNVN